MLCKYEVVQLLLKLTLSHCVYMVDLPFQGPRHIKQASCRAVGEKRDVLPDGP
jgi:hypothetical protein